MKKWEGYDDYEPRDEDDPDVQGELFWEYRESGMSPEDIKTDDAQRAKFAEWLKANPSDSESD